MIKIFLDTNVLFDFFAERKPFDREAEEIMELAYEKQVLLFCSAISYTTIFYLLSRLSGKQKAFMAIKDMRELINTVLVDGQIIDKALENGNPDFEDGIQLECATSVPNLHALVTRNPKHFKNKQLLIQTPKEFLDAFNQTIHE
jgi:predicted nucleic acid-binding protein